MINMPFFIQIEKAELREMAAMVVNRGVLLLPIHRQADAPPEFHERFFVLFRQFQAEFDKIFAGKLKRVMFAGFRACVFALKIFDVWDFRVAGDMEIVLHAAFGRQAVVVPAHRIENIHAQHPFVADNHVGMRVAENMPHVERTGDGRRRRIHDKGLFARHGSVITINLLFLPKTIPALFGFGGVKMFGKGLRVYTDDFFAFCAH